MANKSGSKIKVEITGDAAKYGKALKDAEKETGSFADKAGEIFGKLKIVAAAGALAAVAAVGLAFGEALEQERIGDKLAVQMDLSGPAAERAGDLAGSLYAEGFGDSMGDTAEAVRAVGTQLVDLTKVSDEEAEHITSNAMAIADAFDLEVGDAVKSAGLLLKRGLADSAEEGLDQITWALKGLPAEMADPLMEAADEYGTFFSQLGVEGENMFAILKAAAEDGEWALDKTGDALKEFTIRGTDMSTASVAAYDAIGLSAEDMSKKLLEGGDAGAEALALVAGGLLDLDDPVAQAAHSIALFGTPLEDIGTQKIPEFLANMGLASAEMESVAGAADNASNQLYDNASTRLEKWKRTGQQNLVNFIGDQVLPRLEKLGEVAGPIFTEISDRASDFADKVNQYLAPVVEEISDWVSSTLVPALEKFGSWLANNEPLLIGIAATIGGALVVAFGALAVSAGAAALSVAATIAPFIAIGAVIAAVIAGLVYAYRNWDWFRESIDKVATFVTKTLWPILQKVGKWLASAFTSAIKTVGAWITNTLFPAFQKLAGLFMNTVVPAVQKVISVIIDIAKWIKTHVWPVITALGGLFAAVWNRIVDIISVAWTVISNVIKVAWTVIEPIIKTGLAVIQKIWDVAWAVISAVIPPIFNHIKTIIESVLKVIQGVIKTVTGLISGDWGKVWEGIKNILSGVWNAIKSVITTGLNIAKNLITNIGGVISRAWSGIWDGIKNAAGGAINAVVDFLRNLPGRILGFVATIGSAAADIGSTIASKIGEGIGNIVGKIGDIAHKLWRGVADFINDKIIDKINDFSVDVPILGTINFPNLPRLHTGGVVPGRGEKAYLLEAGESVRTARQEATLQTIIQDATTAADRLAHEPAGVEITVVNDFSGALLTHDLAATIVRLVDEGIAKGHQAHKLKRWITT